MGPTRYTARTIPRISLRDFPARIDEITAQLVRAAETDGFFALADTGITVAEIESMFRRSEAFFALPPSQKATVPWSPRNVGWESNAQVRPSTGTADLKESYQLQFGRNMRDPDAWVAEDVLPGFREAARAFMVRSQAVSEMVMVCLARGLGFADDYFVKAHDVTRPEAQSVLRLIYYPEQDRDEPVKEGYYRAGPHADWDLLTLLYQRPGQSGLEICPGRESVTEFGIGDEWTKVDFAPGDIVCNIGDLLMSWSDDRFKSTFHRVKTPEDKEKDYWGPRYSMAFFNQPCWDCKIQGPKKKYPMVTGEEFNRNAMQRNFAALKAKVDGMEKEKNASDAEPIVSASVSVGAPHQHLPRRRRRRRSSYAACSSKNTAAKLAVVAAFEKRWSTVCVCFNSPRPLRSSAAAASALRQPPVRTRCGQQQQQQQPFDESDEGGCGDGGEEAASRRRREALGRVVLQMRDFCFSMRDGNPELVRGMAALATYNPEDAMALGVLVSSVGGVDGMASPTHGALELGDPWALGEGLKTGLELFLGTWRGQLSLSAAYNDAWHDKEDVLRFLQDCEDTVFHGLGI